MDFTFTTRCFKEKRVRKHITGYFQAGKGCLYPPEAPEKLDRSLFTAPPIIIRLYFHQNVTRNKRSTDYPLFFADVRFESETFDVKNSLCSLERQTLLIMSQQIQTAKISRAEFTQRKHDVYFQYYSRTSIISKRYSKSEFFLANSEPVLSDQHIFEMLRSSKKYVHMQIKELWFFCISHGKLEIYRG